MMNDNAMFELAEQLRALREEKKDAEQHLKQINEQIDETDYRLSELMAESETQNFTRSGMMFYLTTETRASAVAGSKESQRESVLRQSYLRRMRRSLRFKSMAQHH